MVTYVGVHYYISKSTPCDQMFARYHDCGPASSQGYTGFVLRSDKLHHFSDFLFFPGIRCISVASMILPNHVLCIPLEICQFIGRLVHFKKF